MACLNAEQIEFIRSGLKDRSISRSFLFEEWMDHVCCDVETLMNKGVEFEQAFEQVAGGQGSKEVKKAHKTVQSFLNHNYVGIKKLLLFAFSIFSASWVINIQYGSQWISLASFLILSLVYFRISLDFLRKRYVARINILLSVFSFLSFLGTIAGILLIFLFRNYGVSTRGHGVDLTVFAWFFSALTCLIYYLREYRSSIETREILKTRWFISLAILNLLLSLISIATFPLYRIVQSYIFYLILLILAFNVLALLFLVVTSSLKNTLILSLVIGSFMIVFIHSHFRHRLPGGKPKLYQLSLQYVPKENIVGENLYISMYYDKYPEKPITLPLKISNDGWYKINMPSYSYRGYLYYRVRSDSTDAREYFRQVHELDSIQLNIPNKTTYLIK